MVDVHLKRAAYKLIVLFGLVSLLADVTYEGARSITGPYLALLGASGFVVGVVAGLGELIGYALRLLSGYISDRTRKYWTLTILGYFVNLLAVPMLALAGSWEMAGGLIILERFGKAIRTPARDAMLSHATLHVGRGWGFGLHEAMDQIGAMLGPVIVTFVLYFRGSYSLGFAILLVPAVLALTVLFFARYFYPNPRDFEAGHIHLSQKGFDRRFWLYLLAIGFIAAGFADFPLVAFHFKKTALASDAWIPVFYAIAMGIDALAALVFGRLFDRIGFSVLMIAAALSAFFAPLVFLGGFYPALAGVLLWGIGMGAQESVMRAAVAQMIPSDRRGSGYGIFSTGYGLFWFLGSAALGFLYDRSIMAVVIFSMACQLFAVPLLSLVRSKMK